MQIRGREMSKISRVSLIFSFFVVFALTQASSAFAATKCPTGQVPSYFVKGKCIKKTVVKAGLTQFTTDTCTTCHGSNSNLCPSDLGAGSCTFKKMAKTIKLANGTKKSVSPQVLIELFTAYASYMPDVATPTTSQAQKYLNYLASLKQ